MKKKLSLIVATLIVALLTQNLWAQVPIKAPVSKTGTQGYSSKKKIYSKKPTTYYRRDTVKNNDFSLNGQYQFMLSRSKTINGYKLINTGRLAGVWQSALDTLKKERKAFKATKNQLEEQQKTITSLQSEIDGQEKTLDSSNAKLNEISFIGMSFEKGTYHAIVWSIIVALGIGLVVVIARSGKNSSEAKHRTQLYDEITAEFQAFKSKANEQQRKLARELQDERNIVEELKNRP
jgi:uncharacterized protein HemX